MQAVIFDFNGTMFFDTDKHVEAWKIYLRNLFGKDISNEEYNKHVHGKINADILAYYMNRTLEISECEQLAEGKEKIYRDLCALDDVNLKLVEGLPELLDYLKNKKIPFTIATAATKNNLDFYFEQFDLARWFTMEQIVYDDGTVRGKPNPDIYIKAAETLGVHPQNCMVVEDSVTGITAAHSAGVGKIVAITSDLSSDTLQSMSCVSAIIDNYNGFEKLI
jgi:haloacid dehalogenase superfamily, subfamily IA, variant 3 with third motif having DD or ED/haloacid dehalogenase superfamily, subfamily IA, variant 1 with third motif having Dx(3-4)D or Dx(3-4)E